MKGKRQHEKITKVILYAVLIFRLPFDACAFRMDAVLFSEAG